jgi:altronate hydrolase
MNVNHPNVLPPTAPRMIRLAAADNVAVAVSPLAAGEEISIEGLSITVVEPIRPGHKVALLSIGAGQPVLKYGLPIGSATRDILPGQHVHSHNLQSNYAGLSAI